MPTNADGSLRAFTPAEISLMDLETVDVRNGAHPTETREVDQNTMRRAYFCDWAQRYNAVKLICGDQSYYFGGDGFWHISRIAPDATWGQHPYALFFVATKIEKMSGHGRPSGEDQYGLPTYPKCRLDVLLTTVPYNPTPIDADIIANGRNEFARYTWTSGDEAGGDSVTGRGGQLKFFRDPATGAGVPNLVPIPYSFNVIRPYSEFSYKWERVPYEAAVLGTSLRTKLDTWAGMINSAEFPSVGGAPGFPAGTILYLGASKKLQRPQTFFGAIAKGYWMWSIELKFMYVPTGHLNLRYFDLAGGGAGNGWFMAGTSAFRTPATLNDYESIVQGARDLNQLFVA